TNDPTEVIAFERDGRKHVSGMLVNAPRMRKVLFRRGGLQGVGRSALGVGGRRPGIALSGRAGGLKAMQGVMGELPRPEKRVPLDVKVESEERTDKYLRRKISYQSYRGERVPAYLLIPLGLKGKAPAMLCLTQTSSFGKNEVVGLEGKRDLATG